MNKKVTIIGILVLLLIMFATCTVLATNYINENSVIKRMEKENTAKIKYNGLKSLKQEVKKEEYETKLTEEEAQNISNMYAYQIAKVNVKNLENYKTQNDATFLKMSNIINKTNKDELNLVKDNVNDRMVWYQKNNDYYSRVDAETGNLILLHYNITDLPKCTKKENEIEKIASELFKNLQLNENYKLYSISQFDDATWIVMFADKSNPYSNIKMTIIPETKVIESISIHDEKCEDNEILIDLKTAQDIAKKFLKNKSYDISKINANVNVRKVNDFWNDSYTIRHSSIIRNVWEVEATVKEGNKLFVYIDATTGEIVGGDAYEK